LGQGYGYEARFAEGERLLNKELKSKLEKRRQTLPFNDTGLITLAVRRSCSFLSYPIPMLMHPLSPYLADVGF
jgi:hypothetical protein